MVSHRCCHLCELYPAGACPVFFFLLFCLQKTKHCLVQCGCTQAKYISHLVFFNIEPENNSATKTLACLISIQYKQAALITCANTLVYKHWQSRELHCHWKARFCQGTDMGSEWNGSLPLRNKKNSASSNTTYHSNSSVTFFLRNEDLRNMIPHTLMIYIIILLVILISKGYLPITLNLQCNYSITTQAPQPQTHTHTYTKQ